MTTRVLIALVLCAASVVADDADRQTDRRSMMAAGFDQVYVSDVAQFSTPVPQGNARLTHASNFDGGQNIVVVT